MRDYTQADFDAIANHLNGWRVLRIVDRAS
jgi:hypothetical protein